MNLVRIAELLKNAPDQTLMQEMQNPSGSVPSYMVLSELDRRKKLRGSIMNNEPQSSVADDLEMEASRANQMGIGSMNPYTQAPQEMPQEAQGYAGGGEVQGYAAGDYVDYGGGYPVDAGENTFWPSWDEIKKRTGYGRMLPQATPAAASAPASPANAPASTPAASKSQGQSAAQSGIRQAPIPIPKDAEPRAVGFVDSLLKNADADRTQMREAHQKFNDMLAAQTEEVKKSKNTDIALTLMQAGLGIAGGRSQYAMENIGQGAQPALQAYMGMDRDRQKQLSQLAMAQGQAGIAGLKDIQGINKDLATLEYQKQHGEYFGKAGEAALMNARTNAATIGQAKAAANETRIIALREKAIESLSKDQGFQFLSPQQQEAAIQRRMQLIGIPGAGGVPAAPAIAGTYNPKTGKIE